MTEERPLPESGGPSGAAHVDRGELVAFADGSLPLDRAERVEEHVTACDACRAGVREAIAPLEASRRARLRETVLAEVRHRRRPRAERVLVTVGMHEADARLLAVTPSLRVPWQASVALVAAMAAGLARVTDGHPHALLVFLVIAPLLPVAGVAAAFGRRVDPTHDLAVAAPVSLLRLMLLRAVAVLTASLVITTAAAAALPAVGWAASAWVLPALALTSVTLVASSRFDVQASAATVAALWVAGVAASEALLAAPLATFAVAGQGLMVVVLVLSAVGLAIAARRPQTVR